MGSEKDKVTPPVDLSIQEAFGVLNPDEDLQDDAVFNVEGQHVRYHFFPTWRSQLGHIFLFFLFSYLAVRFSLMWPDIFVINGELFRIGRTIYLMDLPWAVLIPFALLGKMFLYIYDAKYIIDERGVEAQVGLVSLSLRQPRLRYEDIRGVEPRQTLWERFLGIGSVLIGSAMTDEVEIVMVGVPNPRAIQLLINSERDKKMKLIQRNIGSKAEKNIIMGD